MNIFQMRNLGLRKKIFFYFFFCPILSHHFLTNFECMLLYIFFFFGSLVIIAKKADLYNSFRRQNYLMEISYRACLWDTDTVS